MSVIEHVEGETGDSESIREMIRVLKPGAPLLVTVPVGERYVEQDRLGFEGAARETGNGSRYFFQRIYTPATAERRIFKAAANATLQRAVTISRKTGVLAKLYRHLGTDMRGALGCLNPVLSAALNDSQEGAFPAPSNYGDLHSERDIYGDLMLAWQKQPSKKPNGGQPVLGHRETVTGFMSELRKYIVSEIEESIAVKAELARCACDKIVGTAALILERLEAGGKLIAFGNGGSAADAQHIAAEFVGRYRAERKALAAIALTTDSSSLTAIGNDFGFEEIFSRQLEAIGKPGDVVLAISTSGNSHNVLRAVATAKKLGMATIGLSGKSGGKMRDCVDVCLCVPSDSTPRIQEAHVLIIHILVGIVENALVDTAHSSMPLR
jgi:D-sedoheptulose 7-phosphate isomerase